MNLFEVYPLFPIEIVRGSGSYVWDNEGTRYLDLYGGHAVISIGHSHPHYREALKAQIDKIGFYSNSVQIRVQQEAAEELCRISGYSDYSVFFCNSGSEANENAFKLASFQTGRKKIMSFLKSFHGRTSLSIAATDNKKIAAPVNSKEDIHFFELNDTSALDALGSGEFCCVIIEGIQGLGGIYLPDNDFITALASRCKETGTVLILDEVQSGFGRTGKFFAHQYTDIRPDLITVAKGMGNGFPVGGVLISPMFKASYGLLGTTFGGTHLATTAVKAVIEVMEKEKLIQNAAEMGEYLVSQLKKVDGLAVRGRGLMVGIDLPFPASEVRKDLLFNFHIFTGSAKGANTIRLLPPLSITKDEIDYFISSLKQILPKTA